MVSGPNLLDLRTDFLHDASALMTEHDRKRNRPNLVLHLNVGVADPYAGDPNQDLVIARGLKLQSLD